MLRRIFFVRCANSLYYDSIEKVNNQNELDKQAFRVNVDNLATGYWFSLRMKYVSLKLIKTRKDSILEDIQNDFRQHLFVSTTKPN